MTHNTSDTLRLMLFSSMLDINITDSLLEFWILDDRLRRGLSIGDMPWPGSYIVNWPQEKKRAS